MICKRLLNGCHRDEYDQKEECCECLLIPLIKKSSYLDYLSKLNEEYLDEDEYDFSVHDSEFPVIGLWHSVSIVEETVFGLNAQHL